MSFYYNPTSYTSPTNFTTGNGRVTVNIVSPIPNQFTAYMLVNSKPDLINIATNLSGTYALGKDINATGGAMFRRRRCRTIGSAMRAAPAR